MNTKEIPMFTSEIQLALETNLDRAYDMLLLRAEDKEKSLSVLVEECAECYELKSGYTVVEYLKNLDFAAQAMFESNAVSDLVRYLNETHCWIK